jgi:hypothetical protein
MPERVLERIVRVSSKEGQVVLDPFSGSGTTCCVAARLRRRYLGLDISEKYVAASLKRLAETLAGRYKATDIAEDPESLRPERVARRFGTGSASPEGGRLCGQAGERNELPVLPGLGPPD